MKQRSLWGMVLVCVIVGAAGAQPWGYWDVIGRINAMKANLGIQMTVLAPALAPEDTFPLFQNSLGAALTLTSLWAEADSTDDYTFRLIEQDTAGVVQEDTVVIVTIAGNGTGWFYTSPTITTFVHPTIEDYNLVSMIRSSQPANHLKMTFKYHVAIP